MTPPGLEATRIARLATLFTRCRSAVSPLPGKLLSRWMPAMAAALFVSAALVWQYTPDPLPALLSRPVSPVLLDSDGELIHARLSLNEEWHLPVPLEAMGTWLPRVLVAVEDKRFYSHHGIDFLALGRALVQNAASGRVLSGASTITSQLVRLGTPRPRTLLAKTMEFVGALKLEARLEKEQILELYLNHAPFGGPIRGVEAAARLYFGKRAKDLSLGEASLLVGLLKGPTAYRPDKNPWAALNRRQQIIALVANQIAFPADLRTLALEEPLPAFRPSMPSRARHFADLAFKTLPPEGGVVPSSLDTRAQDLLEQSLRERLAFAGPDVTAAGIIVDNRSSSIIAYVGNALFDPERGRHWVDCALAPRSPGSTLKPFIYLAAMDSGRIIPEGLLADTPLRLGGEAPRNFSLRYRGPVTVKTALADSLNTPAVRVLRMVGVNRGLARLRQAGFAHLTRNDEDYGDSLVLGAGEVTLLELARAYSALARLGDDRPLLLRARQAARPDDIAVGRSQALDALAGDMGLFRPVTLPSFTPSGLADVPLQLRSEPGALPSRQIGTPGAAFLIADMLKETGRLPSLARLSQSEFRGMTAFKTGTSFGLRDAWTVAYTPDFTAAIWFGRENGGDDPSLIGLGLAAPAAVGILHALNRERRASRWFQPPEDVARTMVCSLSGAAPSPYCPARRSAWHIPAVWATRPCALHVFRDGKNSVEWPPELEDFNRKRFAGEDLSRQALIVSPMPGARYLITPGARRNPLPLKAEGVSYPVHWYVDGEYQGLQTRDDLPLYWRPAGGDHFVSLLDADERESGMAVRVTDLSARVDEAPLAQ